MTYRQAKTKFEELGEKFSRKMRMEHIMDMMNKGELTMEEGEIELRNLESRENKDNNTMNDKHDNNRNKPVRPDPVKPIDPEQKAPKENTCHDCPPHMSKRDTKVKATDIWRRGTDSSQVQQQKGIQA